jgi:hypothetical protein
LLDVDRVLLAFNEIVEALSDGWVVDSSHASLDLVGSDAFLYT